MKFETFNPNPIENTGDSKEKSIQEVKKEVVPDTSYIDLAEGRFENQIASKEDIISEKEKRKVEVMERVKRLEQDMEEAEATIRETENMEPGSAKVEAALEMRRKFREEDEHWEESKQISSGLKSLQYNYRIDASEPQKLEELKTRYKKIQEELMRVWWDAKGQVDDDYAEVAKDYTEILKTDISFDRVKEMLSSESLDDSSKEYLAIQLIKKYEAVGKDEDAVNVAALARAAGFYKTMSMDSVNADFVKSLKYKNPDLYKRGKTFLGPNTQPYV